MDLSSLDTASIIFIAVSMITLVMQTSSMVRIVHNHNNGNHRPGLIRTAICRVVAAVLYVLLGSAVPSVAASTAVTLSLACFAGVQVMWIINGIADARLGTSEHHAARHRIKSPGDAR
jgi:hypothetical protein